MYGDFFSIFNVHSLCHLPHDVIYYGSLDKTSAFPFESFMAQLKRKIRHGRLPLQQLVGRLSEVPNTPLLPNPKPKLHCTPPNNVYFVNNKPAEVMEKLDGLDLYNCRVYNSVEPIFTIPCPSTLIGSHKVVNHSATSIIQLNSADLVKKGFKIVCNNKTYFLTMLHEC